MLCENHGQPKANCTWCAEMRIERSGREPASGPTKIVATYKITDEIIGKPVLSSGIGYAGRVVSVGSRDNTPTKVGDSGWIWVVINHPAEHRNEGQPDGAFKFRRSDVRILDEAEYKITTGGL